MQKYEHGGNIYQNREGGWVDFSANINPLGLSEKVRQAILQGIEHVVHYPDPHAQALKAALAKHYRVETKQFLLGNGAAELFYLLFYQLRPQRVLLLAPTFSEYEKAALAAGADIIYHVLSTEREFALDEDLFTRQMEQVNMVVLANPNNPTGRLLEKDFLLRLAEQIESRGKYLLLDESFLEFLPDRENYTMRYAVKKSTHLLVVQSMTKFYAIPGLRLGFAVLPAHLAERMEAGKDVWNVNHLAQLAGIAAVQDIVYQERTRQWLQSACTQIREGLSVLTGVKVYSSPVNYCLFSLDEKAPFPARYLLKALKEKGILLRDCSNYRGLNPSFLRTAVRSVEENKILLQSIQAIWEEGEICH